jgi:ribosomal protein S18 acetylase RimI-like enzyme
MQEYNKKLYEYSPAKMFSYQTIEQSYMEKMKNIYKNQGLKILLKQMMKKMLSPIIITNSAIWFEKDLTEELTDYKLKFPVEVDTSSIDKTINWLKNQKESWVVNQEEITTAYKYNHCWPFVSINGKIIGCIKIGFDSVFILDYKQVIKFPEKIAFIYDTFVLEEQRGKGIGKYLINQAIKFLKSQGYTKVRCHIPPWNKISIGVYEKMGFKKISYIRFFRIFRVPIKKVTPAEKISNI